jgi:hypothetical protein
MWDWPRQLNQSYTTSPLDWFYDTTEKWEDAEFIFDTPAAAAFSEVPPATRELKQSSPSVNVISLIKTADDRV